MNWFSGSIPDAIVEAKRNNKIFLVFIEGNDDMSKKMMVTYNDPVVTKKLSSSNVVALKLVAHSQSYLQFSAIFPVLVIPSSFFIGKNGTPVEIITGNLDPSDFLKKIDNVFEIHETEFANSPVQMNMSEQSSKSLGEPSTSSSSVSENQISSNVSTGVFSSSDVPSTSQTVSSVSGDLPETSQALEERVERAKALLEIQRQAKEAEEKEKAKKDEIERRTVGKAIQEAQKTKQETELQEWARNRAKDKEEERLARETVRAQIAQDRAERAAKYQQVKEAEQNERERMAHMIEEQDRAARNAAMRSNDARLQFRLPDGSFTSHSFSADSTLTEARQFVTDEIRPPFSNFTLCTTFPRRHFTESNYSETLRDLQLAPSAVLLILPAQAVVSVNQDGFLLNLFWMLVSPFTTIWRFITSFFPGNPPRPVPTPPSGTEEPQQQSTSRLNNQTGATSDGQTAHQRRGPNFYKREGNVFRINNQSDDDDNNTWNGNSTQQM